MPEIKEIITKHDITDPDIWWHHVEQGVEVSFAFMYSNVCPKGLANLVAGRLQTGLFYPYGSVSQYFWEKQHQFDKDNIKQQDVYFIRSKNGGPVKIGIAKDINARLAQLQTAHAYPLEIIGLILCGGRKTEKLLHKQFAKYQLCNEWFEWNKEIEEAILCYQKHAK